MFNVHALGGRAMMEAAKSAADRGAREENLPPALVIAVTIVTSLGEGQLRDEIGVPSSPAEAAVRLAALAKEAGLDGVVCSAGEVGEIKGVCGEEFLAVTPGVRPTWVSRSDDQARVATPREAVDAGSDYLVIGRPITNAADPVEALAKVIAEITISA
jgi:orotidine-5'-phosphate decarboxylase